MSKIKNIIRSPKTWLLLGTILLLFCVVAILIVQNARSRFTRISSIDNWFAAPKNHSDWQIKGAQRCNNAPMLLPTTGFIGVSWDDGMPPLYQHTGLDIFSPDGADNITPIVAAFDGYLTREENWRSAVIIRHPDAPEITALTGGEQIWTYYTHMASRDGTESFISPQFPPGIRETFVEAGTLLGYQGSWSGNPQRQMGRHLHFSIAMSNENGSYKNETQIENTLNPLPFLGLVPNEEGILNCGASE